MKISKIIIFTFLLSFCLLPNLTLAKTITNPLLYDTLEDLVVGVANFIFWVATAVAPLMIVIAGFYFITSSGNPQQIETAKKIILYTLVGYGIIFISRGMIFIVRDILGVTTT